MAILKSLNIDGDLILDKGTGTASQVAGAAGPAAVFESAASGTNIESRISICLIGTGSDPSSVDGLKRVVMAYEDEGNSNRLTAVVGTISDMNMSFGTPVPFGGTQTTGGRGLDMCSGSTGNIIIVYSDNSNSNYGTVIVGTVTGLTITFQSPQVFESATTRQPRITSLASTTKYVIAYGDEGNFDAGTAVHATLSGTTLTFGTPVVMIPPWGPSFASRMDIAYQAAGDTGIVIVYADLGNSNYLTAIVGTISGTVITFGSPVVFYATNTQNKPFVFYDSDAQKIVVAWKNSSGAGRARVGTVTSSNQSISFGTEAGFTSNNIDEDFAIAQEYDYANEEVGAGPAFIYHDTTLGKLVCKPGTISGTSLNFYTAAIGPTVDANKIVAIGTAFDEKVICAYVDASNSNYGTGIIWRVYTAGGITVDLATGNFFEVDFQGIGDIHTFTVNNVNATPGQITSFDLKMTQGDTSPRRTKFRWDPLSGVIRWPGGGVWPVNGEPSDIYVTDAEEIWRLTTYDNGTSWYGKEIGQNFHTYAIPIILSTPNV